MDKIIEGAKLVEIDKSKKYVIIVTDSLSINDISRFRDDFIQWLNDNAAPVCIIHGDVIQLLEVEKDE